MVRADHGAVNHLNGVWDSAAIIERINKGVTDQMPAQAGRLTEAQINVLTAYVWGKSFI